MSVRLISFDVRNFRLFRRATLHLHPDVNVLVGLNDTGKSTLLEALYLYGLVQRVGFRAVLERDDFEATGADSTQFRAIWDVNGKQWEHTVELDPADPHERLSGNGHVWFWRPRQHVLEVSGKKFKSSNRLAFRSFGQIKPKQWQLESNVPSAFFVPISVTRKFQVPPGYLFQAPSLAKNSTTTLKRPLRTGYGWAQWLVEIVNRRDGTIERLEAECHKLFPHFQGVRVVAGDTVRRTKYPSVLRIIQDGSTYRITRKRASKKEKKIVEGHEQVVFVKTTDDRAIRATNASAGLLLALAHLALVYANPEGGLVLLEEPENGLNETIMLDMMRVFLSAVRNRRQQLILTTHQAWWLDLVPHDAIRVMTRDDEGGHVHAPKPEEIRRVVEQRNLYPSEVMSLHGPEGLLRLGRVNQS